MKSSDKSSKTVRIETLGCRLNQIESESIARFFIDSGFEVKMGGLTASSPEDSFTALNIINTCAVTQKAEQKGRRLIRLMLKKYPQSVVLVTGCYAQLSAKEIQKIDSRIVVVGGQIKSRISQVPELLKNSKTPAELVEQITQKIVLPPPQKSGVPENSFALSTSSFINHSRASLKIQDGCNCVCSYCTINKARGHSVSLPVETAVSRVKALEESGQTEVVITSVHIDQYRSEWNGKLYNFPRLLKELLSATKKIRFRISSIYPEVVTDEFCKVIKDERVQPHFHISIQSGSNKILNLMKRSYTREEVISACKKLRSVKPDVFLAADIITGFPGETDEDFLLTQSLCQECELTWVHAFPFSERPGTTAVQLPDKVPQNISGQRCKTLTKLAVQNKIEYINKFIGRELEATIENIRRPSIVHKDSAKAVFHAVTSNFIHCEITSSLEQAPEGTVKVKILQTLKENITKGGDLEAEAELV